MKTEKALLPAVADGTVVMCISTCDPDRIEALGKRLAGTKIRFLETPVSGTSEQVRQGDGVGLIGGDPKIGWYGGALSFYSGTTFEDVTAG